MCEFCERKGKNARILQDKTELFQESLQEGRSSYQAFTRQAAAYWSVAEIDAAQGRIEAMPK